MLGFLVRFVRRIRAIKHVHLVDNRSRFIFAGSVNIRCGKGARIVVNNGIVRLGYPLPGHIHHASYATSEITLEEGATLQFDGDACIAPGATLFIGKHATATFAGNNFISHNFKLICTKEFHMGRFSNTSWNVTLIDDDKHRFRRPDGQVLRGLPRPLIIGDNVGLQMNVSIPRGVRIGNCSVIAGGMTVRENIPEYSTAFEEVKVKVKHGFCCGPVPEQK
jgi:acetyltransferase-like isoleucine patch superfamily enzyme